MKRKTVVALLTGVLVYSLAGSAEAKTFRLSQLQNLGGPIMPEIDDNPGLYREGTLIDAAGPGDYVWDFGEDYKQVVMFVSTDHLEEDRFSFKMYGSPDLEHWKTGRFAAAYRAEEPEPGADDYATVWQFKNPIRYVSADSRGTMILSESDEIAGSTISPKAEYDGVGARVPEPGVMLLTGLGLAGLAFFRGRDSSAPAS